MGDIIPSLADLIVPLISVECPEITWSDGSSYTDYKVVGRYRNAFVLSIRDDSIIVRNKIKPLMAANPEFIKLLRESLTVAFNDINEFEINHLMNN